MGAFGKIGFTALFGLALNVVDAHLPDPAMPWNKAHQDAIQGNRIDVQYFSNGTIVRESTTGNSWEFECTKPNLRFTKQLRWNFTQDGYIITCPNTLGGAQTQPGTIKERVRIELPFGIDLN